MASESDDVFDDVSISLSCNSSEFDEEGHVISTLSDYSLSDDNVNDELGVSTYMFEPVESNPTSDDSDHNVDEPDILRRLDDSNCCDCEYCIVMSSARECVCCSEMYKVQMKKDDVQVNCITNHPGYSAVCLNRYVLEVAYLQYRQQYGEQ